MTPPSRQVPEAPDPLARLLEAIEKAERTAPFIHAEGCDGLPPPAGLNGPFPCDCDVPEGIRRRCAADRRIVRTWQVVHEARNASADMRVTADEFVRHLAEGYGISLEQETSGE